jgi:hypothetical protein
VQSFRFDELDPPAPGVAAARSACDTDILVLAIRENRMLPTHIESWLRLCLGLRDEDQEDALVVLIAKARKTRVPNSSLSKSLKRTVTIAGLAFFERHLDHHSITYTGWSDEYYGNN